MGGASRPASWREGPQIWDPSAGGQPLASFAGHLHPISALVFSPDGRRLASASFDRSVKLWDTTTGDLIRTLPHTGNVLCVAFSPDGRRLASSGEDKIVHIWDAQTGREVLGLRGHTDWCGCVVFSADGQRLASASTDGTIRIWDATPLQGNEGREALLFSQHSDEIRSVAVSPDGHWIASAGFGGAVKVWDAATGKVRAEFNEDALTVFDLVWHPDGKRIAFSTENDRLARVRIWDVANEREVLALSGGREYLAVAFSPNGRYLVTGRVTGVIEVWDAETGRQVGTLGRHLRDVRGLVFSHDGRHLATVSPGGEVRLWDATRLHAKQAAFRSLRVRVPRPSANVAFSPDGQWLATGGEENTIKLWDVLQSDKDPKTLRGHSGEVYTIAFSLDGKWIASAGEDSTVKVWDSHSGKLVRNFRGHTGLVVRVAFSPDSRRLVSGCRDATVKVWDLTSLGGQ